MGVHRHRVFFLEADRVGAKLDEALRRNALTNRHRAACARSEDGANVDERSARRSRTTAGTSLTTGVVEPSAADRIAINVHFVVRHRRAAPVERKLAGGRAKKKRDPTNTMAYCI